jgi:hypothetical protein
MSMASIGQDMERTRHRRQDHAVFHALVIATYPAFLVAAVLGRRSSTASRRSVFGEAWAAANRTIPYVFMG